MRNTYKKLVCQRYSLDIRAASEIVEVELQPPGPAEAVVRTRFGGVNASDINISGGVYFSDGLFPFDLGCESIGEVVMVGDAVLDLEPGDCVISPRRGSAFTEILCRAASELVKVPTCSAEMMTSINSGVTASIGLNVVGEMGTGETVLVTAAAGGVGSWCVQLAKRAGNHVIGTCGSEAKATELRRLGCDRVVLYREEDLGGVLASEYPDGVDLVFEQVGGPTFDACVDNMARKGRLLICGFVSEYTSGPRDVTAPRIYHKLLWKSVQLRGFLWSDWPELMPEHLARNVALVESGEVQPLVDPTEFRGVDQAVDAVEFLHTGRNIGKVVVTYDAAETSS